MHLNSDTHTYKRDTRAYIYQNKFPIHDQNFVKKTLIKHAQITKLLIRFFHSLFDPNTKEISSDIKMQIQHEIEKVKDNNRNEAIALSKLLELMNYTLRTNYYQCVRHAYKFSTCENK